MSNQYIENKLLNKANAEIKALNLDQKAKAERTNQLKKDIIIAQFLN